MDKPPIPANISLVSGQLNAPWVSWFEQLHAKFNRNGTTANRPSSGVEIGDQYFDKTLGYPVWAKSTNPIVWINAGGTNSTIVVKDYGALGDGVTDDTAAFMAAINATGTNGGAVYVPPGNYVLSTLNINNISNIHLKGDGASSVLIFDSKTTDGIVISGTSGRTIISDLWIVGNASATAGSLINVNTTGNPAMYLSKVIINRGFNALQTCFNVGNVFLDSFMFNDQVNAGIYSNGGIWATNGNINLAGQVGIYIVAGLGPSIVNVDIYNCPIGVSITPPAGITCGHLRFVNVTCENGVFGWQFGGNGGTLVSAFLTNCTGTGNSFYGALFNTDTTGGIDGIQLDGFLASGNAGDGIVIFGGINISVNNGSAGGNGNNGISIAANVQKFKITGVVAGASFLYNNNVGYGIQVAAGSSDYYIITGNTTTGNTAGGIVDGGSGTNKVVTGNI